MPTIDDIKMGSVISFRSKAVNDNNFYHGKVVGFTTSEIAKSYADIYTYNTSVQSADNTVPVVTLQTFLMMQLIEPVDNTEKYLIPFSLEWISTPTLNIIASDRIALVKIYEVDEANIQDVINVLASAGFKAKVDSLT